MKRILLVIALNAITHVIHSSQTKIHLTNIDVPQIDIARLEQEAEKEAQEIDKTQQDDNNPENYVFWSTEAYLRKSPETVSPTLAAPLQTIKFFKQPKAPVCKKRITRIASRIAYCCELGCFLISAAALFAGAIVGCFNASETSHDFSINALDNN